MEGITKSTILPPGFRFHPTDEELITHYLKKKIFSPASPVVPIIAEIDLVIVACAFRALFRESEWFFHSPRDRKYPNGARPNKAAASGYWKATGTDKPILSSHGSQCVGVKKALVFYKGAPPMGIKTDWMMYDYWLLVESHYSMRIIGSTRLDDWVLCRLWQKSNIPIPRKDLKESNKESLLPYHQINHQGLFEEKDIMEKMNYLKDSELVPQEGEVVDEFQGGEFLQEGFSEDLIFGLNSETQSLTILSMKAALETIKRVLSVGGALDEQVHHHPMSPSKKECHVQSLVAATWTSRSMFKVSSNRYIRNSAILSYILKSIFLIVNLALSWYSNYTYTQGLLVSCNALARLSCNALSLCC